MLRRISYFIMHVPNIRTCLDVSKTDQVKNHPVVAIRPVSLNAAAWHTTFCFCCWFSPVVKIYIPTHLPVSSFIMRRINAQSICFLSVPSEGFEFRFPSWIDV
jgi:hypothetical protein